MNAGPERQGIVVASIIAAIALVTGMEAVIALVSDGTAAPVSGAYGAISCAAPTRCGTTVSVQVTDAGGMMTGQTPMWAILVASPRTVPTGSVSVSVSATGNLVHELVVLPFPGVGPGARPTGADGTIDGSESPDEASRSCAADVGDGNAPGSTGWTTVHLAAGRYELDCDQPRHYAAGMFDVLTVT